MTHDGRFYAVGDSEADTAPAATVWRSDDGSAWSLEYRSDVASAASVALSSDDDLYIGGFSGPDPILWTKTDHAWNSAALPSQGAVGSIAEMPGGIAVLTAPFEALVSAFSKNNFVHMSRDRAGWTTVSVFDVTDEADRLGNQLIGWRNRLLLLGHSQLSEIWSTKW